MTLIQPIMSGQVVTEKGFKAYLKNAPKRWFITAFSGICNIFAHPSTALSLTDISSYERRPPLNKPGGCDFD